MSARLVADYAAMDALRGRIAAVGDGFAHRTGPVRADTDGAVTAAGEFGADLSAGAATFALSWSAAFTVFADCGHLLARNLGTAVAVLTSTDDSLSTLAGGGRDDGG